MLYAMIDMILGFLFAGLFIALGITLVLMIADIATNGLVLDHIFYIIDDIKDCFR